MALVLTADEIAALLAERDKLIASIAKRIESIASQDAVVQAATDADNAQKKAYNFYSDQVIGAYEDEREQLNGEYIGSPVTTAEMDLVGQLDSTQRLFPPVGDTKPTRIAEFDDGGSKITTANEISGIAPDDPASTQVDSEQYRIGKQGNREDWLASGFGGTTPVIAATAYIDGAVTPATVQITVRTSSSSDNCAFAVGDTFVAKDGTNQIGIKVLNIVSQVDGDPSAGFCTGETTPPQTTQATCEADGGTWTATPTNYEAVLDVAILVPLSLTTGATIDETWAGFSNTDRTNKVDATDGYTNMLLAMIDDLETMIDSRLTKLNAQKTALELNEDPLLDATALTNVNSSISTLTAWKVSKDVDDTELAGLASERSTRTTQITARIPAIETAMGGFYDNRYDACVDICDTGRGTARIKYFRIDSQDVTTDLLNIEQTRKQSIEDLLDLAGVAY